MDHSSCHKCGLRVCVHDEDELNSRYLLYYLTFTLSNAYWIDSLSSSMFGFSLFWFLFFFVFELFHLLSYLIHSVLYKSYNPIWLFAPTFLIYMYLFIIIILRIAIVSICYFAHRFSILSFFFFLTLLIRPNLFGKLCYILDN